MKRTLALLIALAAVGGSACTAASAPGYHVIKKISLPGAARWDYVSIDVNGRRAYISHGSQVEVLDADTFEHLGTIPNTPGVHGVAIASEFGHGFITAGKDDSVVMFDLKTLRPLSEIKVGKNPDAITYDAATKHVYAMNGDGDSASVIDAADGKLVGNIDLEGNPEFVVSDGKGNIYINLEEKAETVHVDSTSLKVLNRWSLAPGKTATALAFDPETRRLFAGCRGGQLMVVLDADTGAIVSTAPIGERVDAAAFDSATKRVFMSNGGGTISVYHEDTKDKYSLVETITTSPGSKTMGLDAKTQNLFVPANLGGQFTILVFGQ
jgi:DNA-binding beta-propeller fold protein YncE